MELLEQKFYELIKDADIEDLNNADKIFDTMLCEYSKDSNNKL